jgi:hypothetical protein
MQPAETEPESSSASFASLLASLNVPQPSAAETWDVSALADDVATISYERALQSSTRLKSVDGSSPRQPRAATARSTTPRSTSDGSPRALIVTLRLSQAESAQLRERAAEAGMTVSDYLRSCVFEVEALRAQVREALSRFRAVPSSAQAVTHSAPATWRSRLFPRRSRNQIGA